MRNTIPIEPVHSFSYGHLCQLKRLAGTYVGRRRWRRRCRARWRPYLPTSVWLTYLQFDIQDPFYDQLTAVRSRYPLTSNTWPYCGLRLEPIQVKWPGYWFSLDRGLTYFHKLLELNLYILKILLQEQFVVDITLRSFCSTSMTNLLCQQFRESNASKLMQIDIFKRAFWKNGKFSSTWVLRHCLKTLTCTRFYTLLHDLILFLVNHFRLLNYAAPSSLMAGTLMYHACNHVLTEKGKNLTLHNF